MKPFDVSVVGAGSFGAWTAWRLRRAGLSVALVDAYGPGNSRASSGGETRVIRMGYGEDDVYTRWSLRSLAAWRELSERADPPIFYRTGVLWMGHGGDAYMEASRASMERAAVPHEMLSRKELEKRFPQISPGPIERAILETESGALQARRGVQIVAAEAERAGAVRVDAAVEAPSGGGRLDAVRLSTGERLAAGRFVFACGPWLGKLFPDLLGQRIFTTRQEIFYFGASPGDPRFRPPAMPVWLDLTEEMYGIPDLEARGFKVASDRHGPRFDPDTGERQASADELARAREFVARRFPGLADAPVLAAEVCQYENTSNGDFLIDRHPDFENVWLAGGGSGHGFKHGPAVGEYVAALLAGSREIEPRFRIEAKATVQRRTVH